MKNKKGYIFFGIIFYLAFITATGLYIKAISNYEPKITVVYAKKAIEAKTIIKDDMLTEKKVSLSSGHKLAAKSKSEIIGKRTIVNITNGELLLSNKYNDSDNINTLSSKNKNNRLFSVEFKPDQANAWMLKLDQSVDIIFVPNESSNTNSVLNIPKQPNTQQVTAQSTNLQGGYNKKSIVRLENIRVAGVVNDVGKNIDPQKPEGIPKLIIFEVTTEQDQFLSWAKSNGRIEISAVNEG